MEPLLGWDEIELGTHNFSLKMYIKRNVENFHLYRVQVHFEVPLILAWYEQDGCISIFISQHFISVTVMGDKNPHLRYPGVC